MSDASPKLLADDELVGLLERAQQAIDNPRVPMLVPAHVVRTLVEGYRHHRDSSTREMVAGVETGDVLDDVVQRLDAVRDALSLIRRGGTPAELRAIAARALRDDGDADRSMHEEFGYGLESFGKYVRPKYKREREPEDGERRRDLLGNTWEVRYEEGDDDRDYVRARLVEAAEWVSVFALLSASERVGKRSSRKRSA